MENSETENNANCIHWILVPNFQLLTRVQQQAGFVYLSEGKYREASELMHQGNLDVREVRSYAESTRTQAT